jgi:hypothetical protein
LLRAIQSLNRVSTGITRSPAAIRASISSSAGRTITTQYPAITSAISPADSDEVVSRPIAARYGSMVVTSSAAAVSARPARAATPPPSAMVRSRQRATRPPPGGVFRFFLSSRKLRKNRPTPITSCVQRAASVSSTRVICGRNASAPSATATPTAK